MFLSEQAVLSYERDGFVLVPDLLKPDEVEVLLEAIETGSQVRSNTHDRNDSSGRKARLAIWHKLSDDIWGAVSTNPRVVNNIRILLGEEVAFFHGKVMLKEAHSGGAWEWHQDYGYWYNQGFAFPRMLSVFIALDPATSENGCLRVLRGSHKLGRLNHEAVGDQTGADPKRLPDIEPLFEQVTVEMRPGSALFFHCNLLHTSAPNTSDYHRRSFIICYNALHNPQFVAEDAPNRISRVPCPVSPDDAILK
jgi:ectoine hydroxylase-related dioxygenase (phytanoyl-CoA dioxygenase family)